jgi:hypothetical protein
MVKSIRNKPVKPAFSWLYLHFPLFVDHFPRENKGFFHGFPQSFLCLPQAIHIFPLRGALLALSVVVLGFTISKPVKRSLPGAT